MRCLFVEGVLLLYLYIPCAFLCIVVNAGYIKTTIAHCLSVDTWVTIPCAAMAICYKVQVTSNPSGMLSQHSTAPHWTAVLPAHCLNHQRLRSLVCSWNFTFWQHLRSYQDQCRLVTVHTHGNFIVLSQWGKRIRPPAPCPNIPFSHIILILSWTAPVLLMLSTKLGSDKYQFSCHWFDSTENRTPDLPYWRHALYRFGHLQVVQVPGQQTDTCHYPAWCLELLRHGKEWLVQCRDNAIDWDIG